VVACVFAGAANAGSSVHIDMLGQSHAAKAGSAWAYYVRARQDGRPWRGIITLNVQTGAGKVVDHVGRYAFTGSLLAAYVWNLKDRGWFDFRVTFAENGKTVASASYPVRIT